VQRKAAPQTKQDGAIHLFRGPEYGRPPVVAQGAEPLQPHERGSGVGAHHTPVSRNPSNSVLLPAALSGVSSYSRPGSAGGTANSASRWRSGTLPPSQLFPAHGSAPGPLVRFLAGGSGVPSAGRPFPRSSPAGIGTVEDLDYQDCAELWRQSKAWQGSHSRTMQRWAQHRSRARSQASGVDLFSFAARGGTDANETERALIHESSDGLAAMSGALPLAQPHPFRLHRNGDRIAFRRYTAFLVASEHRRFKQSDRDSIPVGPGRRSLRILSDVGFLPRRSRIATFFPRDRPGDTTIYACVPFSLRHGWAPGPTCSSGGRSR
jgi:hypothetical protein